MTDINFFSDLHKDTLEVSPASDDGDVWVISNIGADDYAYLIFDRATARKIGEHLLELTK